VKSIGDVRVTNLPRFADRQGFLVAYEAAAHFQIDLRRVFVVSGHGGAERGKHAHRELTQVLVCLSGACRVTCDDGKSKQEVLLDRPERALVIPPGIWAKQHYIDPVNVLMVLCDLPFDEGDYIRNYEEFIAFRSRQGA
jgi:dTDP-4-dehydrorhamnose 3,5-epimerase-like enzyme